MAEAGGDQLRANDGERGLALVGRPDDSILAIAPAPGMLRLRDHLCGWRPNTQRLGHDSAPGRVERVALERARDDRDAERLDLAADAADPRARGALVGIVVVSD